MEANMILSVDGGGTHTRFLLRSRDGSLSYRAVTGASSFKSVGRLKAAQHLRQGLETVLHLAGATLGDIVYAVYGLSGLDAQADEATYREMLLAQGWDGERLLLVNDALLAFYAAAQPPGLVLIAGTGSIVVGVDATGKVFRIGGWGYGFSDLGSGTWLGCEALKHTLLACDGIAPFAPWMDAVQVQLGAQDKEAMPECITTLQGYDSIAAFAPVLLGAQAEPLRDRILSEGAQHLAAMVKAGCALHWQPSPAAFTIILAGGCLQDPTYASLVRKALPKELRELIRATDALDAVEGGFHLAQQTITERG